MTQEKQPFDESKLGAQSQAVCGHAVPGKKPYRSPRLTTYGLFASTTLASCSVDREQTECGGGDIIE